MRGRGGGGGGGGRDVQLFHQRLLRKANAAATAEKKIRQ